MPTDRVTVSPDQPERLRRDCDHIRCEVGEHGPRQLGTTLVDHEAVCGSTVLARVVLCAARHQRNSRTGRLPTSSSIVTRSSVVTIASPLPDRYRTSAFAAPRGIATAWA